MDHFKNTLTNKTNKELLQIIDHDFLNYTGNEVKAAEEILSSRNVDPAIITNLKDELNKVYNVHQDKMQSGQDKFEVELGSSRNDALDARAEQNPRDSKNINLVALMALLLSFTKISTLFDHLNDPSYWIIYVILETALVLGIAIGLFNRKRYGWVFLFFYSCFWMTSAIAYTAYSYIQVLSSENQALDVSHIQSTAFLGSIAIFLIKIAALIFVLHYFWKARIQKQFRIEEQTGMKIIVTGIGVAICYVYLYIKLENSLY